MRRVLLTLCALLLLVSLAFADDAVSTKPLRKVPDKKVEFHPATALFRAMTGGAGEKKIPAEAIEVIGAGFCRTGTSSLRTALRMLDINCYHMEDVLPSGHGELLSAAYAAHDPKHPLDNKYVNMWMEDLIYQGFKGTVDVPSMRLYKHMMKRFPDAKVVLTYRTFESWYASMTQLQNMLMSLKGVPLAWLIFDKFERALDGTVSRLESELSLQGCFEPLHYKNPNTRVTFWQPWYMPWVKMPNHMVINKTACYNVFTTHNTEVMNYVPKEKLLVFGAKDGWVPLVKHLGFEMPTFPFPKANSSGELGNIERVARILAVIYPIFFIVFGLIFYSIFKGTSLVIRTLFPQTLKAASEQAAKLVEQAKESQIAKDVQAKVDEYVAKFNQSPVGMKVAEYRGKAVEVYNAAVQDRDLNEIQSMLKIRFEEILNTFKTMTADARANLEPMVKEFMENLNKPKTA